MPLDGTAFIHTSPTGGEAHPHAEAPGIWSRTRAAGARLVRLNRVRGFDEAAPTTRGPEAQRALQTLIFARSLIADQNAWVQRRYETRDGRRCAVGALRGAARLMDAARAHNTAASGLLSVAMSRGFTDIETMNDHSTHAEVVSAFDEAIERLRLG